MSDQDFWTTVLSFARSTADIVGQELLSYFGEVQALEKADGSLVTQADRWADEALRTSIREAFPSHGVLSEETEHIFPEHDWCWIIDPLDGTTNFTRGLPLWGISLGLLYQGTPVFGYVHLPLLRQSFYGFWYGESGLTGPVGAYMNFQGDDRPIHTSFEDPSPNHFFSLCARSTQVLQQSVPCKIRMLGVATYNLLTVAMGSTLAGVEATPHIWDIAAIWAIVQAAGGAWVPLQAQPIFPLEVGRNYQHQAYPTLVVSQPALVSVFRPLVESLALP